MGAIQVVAIGLAVAAATAGCGCGEDGRDDGDADSDTDTDGDTDSDADTDSDLDDGPVCTPGGWCWETPLPAGGAVTDLWAVAPGQVVASSSTHMFHVQGDRILHSPPPTLTPFLNRMPVWGSAPDDVWSAGFSSLIHFDGTRWSQEAVGVVGFADSISGFGPDDVWATGFGSLFHYDGAAWTAVDAGLADGTSVTDLWAVGPDETILVGWDGTQGIALSVRPGGVTDLGMPGGDAATFPSAVYATSAGDVWVAAGTVARHLEAGEWTEQPLGPFGTTDAWGSGAGDVWFSGGTTVHHWDGNAMEAITVPGAFNLTAIAGTSPTDVWASDIYGALHRFDGSDWSALKAPIVPGDFVGVSAQPSGEAWAIGNRGSVGHRDASGAWSAEDSPTESPLVGVAATPTETFLFSNGGSYRRLDGDWELVIGGAGLADACEAADGTTWAVGASFARYEGGEWALDDFVPAGGADRAYCVGSEVWAAPRAPFDDEIGALYTNANDGAGWAHVGLASVSSWTVRATFSGGPDDGWVVAVDPKSTARVVMRFDGAEGREVSLAGEVLGVGGSSPDDVWLVGTSGLVRAWDGTDWTVADAPGGPDFAWVQSRGAGAARAVATSGAVWDLDPDGDPAWVEVVPPLAGASVSSRALVDAALAGPEIFGAGDSDEAARVVGGLWERLPGWFSAEHVSANESAGAWFSDSIGRVGHFDGVDVVQPDPTESSADDVVVPMDGDSVFILDRGSVRRLVGASFEEELSTEGDTGAFFAASDSVHWFTGRVSFGDERSEVWRKADGEWTVLTEMVAPIGMSEGPDGRTLAMDADLRLWRREAGAWRVVGEGREGFEGRGVAAHVLDVDDAWALALGGLLHWDGAAWTTLGEPVGLNFLDLRAAPDGSTFAVGFGASVVRRAP